MLASRKGRRRTSPPRSATPIIGFVLAGLMFFPGVRLAIFAEPPERAKAGEGAYNILDESKPDEYCSVKKN